MTAPTPEYEAEQRLRAFGAVIGTAILDHLESQRRGLRRHVCGLRGLAGDVDGNRFKLPGYVESRPHEQSETGGAV